MSSAFSNLTSLIYSQLLYTPPYPTTDCYGKTVIVTGANVGLGFEAARHFTRLQASKVILAVRSISKGEAAARDIEASTHRKGVVEVWQLDLSSYDSVKAFAARCTNDLPRIDAVVENAGIVPSPNGFQKAEEDEAVITVNVVSTFLLALLLLPKLKESAKKFDIRPHLTIVSSAVHGWTTFPERHGVRPDETLFDALSDPARADVSGERYRLSKLLEVFVCRAMCAGRPQPPYPVTINFLDPGLCHSELARDMANFGFWLFKALFARTTEVGARTLVHAALAVGPETHGRYLSDCEVKPPSPLVLSQEGEKLQERVWRELGEKLERIQPGILGNL